MSDSSPSAELPELSLLMARCESEALHLSGAIQPHGALLCLASGSGRITHASANLETVTGFAAEALLGRFASEVEALARIDFAGFKGPRPGKRRTGSFEAGRRTLECTAIAMPDAVLLEIEPARAEPAPPGALVSRLMQSAPAPRGEPADYHAWLIDVLRQLTNFDRVMIYHFHDDWTGEVVAEWARPGLEPFLGLRYPASDIPAIARTLYVKNPCRMIPDVSAAPIPIVGRGTPDLTHSDLRSVSPVHLQYLRNMGVAASFSIPIRSLHGLWGLVACHHDRPYLLSRALREACVSLAEGYSVRLMSALSARALWEMDAAERRARAVAERLRTEPDLFGALPTNEPELSALVAARGVAFGSGGRLVSAGHVPSALRLERLDDWFSQRAELMVQNDHFSWFLDAEHARGDVVRGFLAVKVRSGAGWLRFYWFRPEEVQEIAWGGQPEKVLDQNTGALSPRSSFSRWIEVRRDYSEPWTAAQRITAGKFRQCVAAWNAAN